MSRAERVLRDAAFRLPFCFGHHVLETPRRRGLFEESGGYQAPAPKNNPILAFPRCVIRDEWGARSIPVTPSILGVRVLLDALDYEAVSPCISRMRLNPRSGQSRGRRAALPCRDGPQAAACSVSAQIGRVRSDRAKLSNSQPIFVGRNVIPRVNFRTCLADCLRPATSWISCRTASSLPR